MSHQKLFAMPRRRRGRERGGGDTPLNRVITLFWFLHRYLSSDRPNCQRTAFHYERTANLLQDRSLFSESRSNCLLIDSSMLPVHFRDQLEDVQSSGSTISGDIRRWRTLCNHETFVSVRNPKQASQEPLPVLEFPSF